MFRAPQYFSSTSILSKIEKNCVQNWFLRVSNLRQTYLGIVDYYEEVLDRHIPEKLQPNLEAIARDYDRKNLGKLLQLILGAAINCVNKEKHIEIMTRLSLEIKQGLKIAIDELEYFDENTNNGNDIASSLQFVSNISTNHQTRSDEDFNKLQAELSMVHTLKEKAIEKCSELESTIARLEDEKKNLKFENEKLAEKLTKILHQNDKNSHRFDSFENENLFQKLNNQLNCLQSDLAQMEEQKEDYKINLEIKEKEYQKLLLQVDELQAKLNKFKNDRDELDQLKYLNEEIIKYKSINEVQKKKLEEFQECRKQMKTIEDRNSALIKQICELEEDKKSLSIYKSQLESIKKIRDELRAKLNAETFRADKSEDELKRLYQKFSEMQQENEKMNSELSNLKTEMTNLNKIDPFSAASIDMDLAADHQVQSNNNANSESNNVANLYMTNLSKSQIDLNEKLIRLDYENRKLKESNDERVKLLESQLEDERNQMSKLEIDNRSNRQRIIELEAELKELNQLRKQRLLNSTFSQNSIQEKNINVEELQADIVNLRNLLEKKNQELAEREERQRKHLDKAKETIDRLESHMNNAKISHSLPDTSKVQNDDVCYWRNLCHQKDLKIESLRKQFDQANTFRDLEERLMSIGFHNLVRFRNFFFVNLFYFYFFFLFHLISPLILKSYNLQRKSAEERMYSGNFTGTQTQSSSSNTKTSAKNPAFLSKHHQTNSRSFVVHQSRFFSK